MPIDPSEFPEEVQTAFFIYGLLEDRWDGSSGSYLGKAYSSLEHLFKLYEVLDPKTVLFFIKLYDNLVIMNRHEEAEKRRKAEERKAKAKASAGGGKTYTHSVKG